MVNFKTTLNCYLRASQIDAPMSKVDIDKIFQDAQDKSPKPGAFTRSEIKDLFDMVNPPANK